MRRRTRFGFTLIELVVTVAIIGILASVTVPLHELVLKRTRESDLRAALRQVREAIDAYKRAADEGRIARAADASGYPPTLDVLADGVLDLKSAGKARIYFLRRIPRDPFAPDRTVAPAMTWGKRSYASPPDAPQEGADVFDVYSTASEAGINGVPYRSW